MKQYMVVTSVAVLISVLIFAFVFAEQDSSQVISEESILSATNNFINKVGESYRESPETKLEVNARGQKIWQIRYGKGEEMHMMIEADAVSGEVIYFGNYGIDKEIRKAIEAGSKTRITETEAINAALNYANLVNLPNESKIQKADSPRSLGGHSGWWIRWARTLNGYEYLDNWLNIEIDPISGKLLGFAKNWSAPECSTSIKVNKESAMDMAKEFFMKTKPIGRLGKVVSVQPMIVQPNYYWESFTMPKNNAPAYLAWVIRMERLAIPSEVDSGGWVEIWIDTMDGKIIGGNQTK